MEKNITKVLPKIEGLPTRTGSHHEEKASSSVPIGKNLKNCDKKFSHDLEKKIDAVRSNVLPSKLESDVATEEDDEEFILRLQSSDEEIFEDAIEMVADVKKTTTVEKPDKYFSDIESSDDSQVYEPKSTQVVGLDGARYDRFPDPDETEEKVRSLKVKIPSRELVTGIELEFEPVESEEEDFEESPPLEALTTQPKDILSKDGPLSEVEDVSDETEEGRISTTPLCDEEERGASDREVNEQKEADDKEELDQEQEVVQEKEIHQRNEDDKEILIDREAVDLEKEVDQQKDQAQSVDEEKKAVDEEKPDDQGAVEEEQELDEDNEFEAHRHIETNKSANGQAPSQSTVSDVGEADEIAAPTGKIDCATIELGGDKLDGPAVVKVVKEVPMGNTSVKIKDKVDKDYKIEEIGTSVVEKEEESEADAKVSAKRKALLEDWEDEISNSPKRNKDEEYLGAIAEESIEFPEELELSIEDEISHEHEDCTPETDGADIETKETTITEDECVKNGVKSKFPVPEDTEKTLLSEEETGVQDEMVSDIEAGAVIKEVGTTSESTEADKQTEEETTAEILLFEDCETIPDVTVPEKADKDSENLQKTVEKSPYKPLNYEKNKAILTDEQKSPKKTEKSKDHPIRKDKSIKEAKDHLNKSEDCNVKTADKPGKCSPNLNETAETLETVGKAHDVVEKLIDSEIRQEDKQTQEKIPTEKSGESIAKEDSDKNTDNLTEKSQSLEITEKVMSKEKGSIEEGTSTEKVFDDAEKCIEKSAEKWKDSTEDAESQKAAKELIENTGKSGHTEPDETSKSVNKSVDSSVKENNKKTETSSTVDKTEPSERLKTTVVEPKPTDSTDVKAKTDSIAAIAASTTIVIEIDDETNDEKAKSSEANLNKEAVAVGERCQEDSSQSKEDKQQLETLTEMETGEVSIKTSNTPQETTRKDDNVEMLEIIEETSNAASKSNDDQSSKDDTTMKPSSKNVSVQDDEEPLLMIDTAHKEDNDYNDMDTETEQTATSAQTTDSSSDGSLEIFYDKECLNYDCKRASKNFYRATLFSLNYYKISKKRSKAQFACEECYDRALDSYEEMCRTLKQKQPLLHGATFKAQEYVEIIDSSDEEESDGPGEKFKDENALPKESIELLEAELEGAIRKVMHNVEIQNQLSWTKQILQQRLNNLEEDAVYVSEQLRVLQKKTDNMHNSLYQCPKIKIRQLTPLDLNSGRTYNPETESTIPPVGEVLRGNIHVHETYYAVKNKAIASWVPCKVIEAIDGYIPHAKGLKHYKIKFLKSKYPMLKTVSAKHMAFFNPPKVRLPIGTRVIAYFDATSLSRGKEKMQIPSAFYPGIIAEPLKQTNRFRYLVFYDDGYFQYVYHKDVRLVCSASEQVWEDVHHQSREFIHNYLTQYAVNRPMVQTQKGQSMLVDYNGKWIYARVIDVDCSLVQMLYEGQSRSEWIYRGSTRLGPVYKESNNLVKNHWGTSRISRRTEPFIRYFNGDDSSSTSPQQTPESQQAKPGEVRAVAKKSVSRTDTSHSSHPVPTVRHLNNSTIFVDDDNKPKGKVVYYTARKNLPPRDYVSHICNPSCPFTITHNLLYYSPLAKPLLSGWERQVFRQKSKKFIVYRGPCGKRMRCMEELHRYLRVTENDLNVDNFDFSPETNCLAEYVIESCIVQKKDISNGSEQMPIPCVNYYDNTMPPDCVYSSQRIPTEGVHLNLNKEFLVGCDCEDDCSDKSKCSCWELTYAGAKYGMPNVPNEMVGYQYKRLYEHVPTGIYECNSRCKCKANCINRVVQQPLQSKLQVFKTSNRGWGLRCINDVPRGSFICIYAGHLLTEQKANEGGLDAGDEYFAELDYIEVAEQIKEGYESDVVEPDEDEELYNPEKEDDDDDEFVAPSESHHNKAFNTRLRARKSTKNSTDAEHDSQERQVISFEPNRLMGQPDHSKSEKQTIRKLFGRDEACYIMDAKVTGNLGRYFNHSCSPNLFVQNVFVDTHDLRFPWVAFFAFTHIRAGTELTWNYNYEVGVVPGKVLYCQCGAPNCRQRLL